MDVCSQAMTKERKDFQGTSLETIRHMVSTGIGITLIPQTAIDYNNLIQNSSIKYIPFKNPAPARRVGLLFRKTSNRKVCFQKISCFDSKYHSKRIFTGRNCRSSSSKIEQIEPHQTYVLERAK